jgi:hypothetical protein
MKPHSACYGKVFPPTLVKTDNKEIRAKVFSYLVDHTGVVETGRKVSTDLEAWEECSQCPDLDGCFRLSTGTLLMEIALKG